jgi:hypothetical protein
MTHRDRNSESADGPARGLYAQVQRLARPGAADEAQYGSAGLTFPAAAETLLGLFELSEPMRFPDPDDPDAPDVPYAENARLVWFNGGENTYGGPDLARGATLYQPAALRVGASAVGLPPLTAGQRCYAWLNRQSGRWEVLEPGLRWRRFEMTAALGCGGSAEATAFVYNAQGQKIADRPPAHTILAVDAQSQFSKMATAAGDAGALGVALYLPDRDTWEIAAMQTPGDFWGTLDGDLHRWDLGQTVRVGPDGVLGGYDVFGPNHGPTITAYNPPGGGNRAAYCWSGAAGDRCYCRWDVRRAHYWIMLVEPNDRDWQTLDVVTRTALTIDFQNQTFDCRYYTRPIQLPPWTTLGEEVEH